MALNIKSEEVERLVDEVALLAGESKTEAVRRAMLARKAALTLGTPPRRTLADAIAFLERTIWSTIPPDKLGRLPLTRSEEDEIPGFGPVGL